MTATRRQLRKFLKEHNESIHHFSLIAKVAHSTVYNFLKGGNIRESSLIKIEKGMNARWYR